MESVNAYPLTPLQALFWAGHRLHEGTPLYNMAHTFTLRKRVDAMRFQHAFQRAVDNCDALRTVFTLRDGAPVQRVLDRFPYAVAVVDFSGESDPERCAREWVGERVSRCMDIERCCFDAGLLRLAEDLYIWFLNQHHIICDATSTAIVFQHVAQAYATETSKPGPLFREYVCRRTAESPSNVEERAEYWRDRLRDAPDAPSFYGVAGTSMPARVLRMSRPLGIERSNRLRTLAQSQTFQCRTERITLFNIIAAMLSVFLLRITGERRFVIGMPHHGRESDTDRSTAGLFIDIVPLPIAVGSGATFPDLVAAIGREASESVKHRPFAGLEGVGTQTFDVLFNYQIAQFSSFNGLPAEQEWINPGYGTERLVLQAHDFTQSGEISLYFDFDADVFDAARRDLAVQHFLRLLDCVLDEPETSVSALHVLTDADTRHILNDFNPPEIPLPQPALLPELFEEQACQSPNAPAVRYGEDRLTYAQLDRRANQLGRYLRDCGIGANVPVGLCLERSPNLIVGMLGILKAGGAYVPLDASYPAERLEMMARDAAFTVLVTQVSCVSGLPPFEGHVLCLDRDWNSIACKDDTPLTCPAGPDSLAYLMYTSGSTGVPKAVAVPHRAVVRLARHTNYITIDSADRVAQASNASFDAATFEVWGALLNGAELVGIPQDIALMPTALAETIAAGEISVLFLTTALFNQIVRIQPDAFRALRVLLFGGEACDPGAIRRVVEHGKPHHLLHVYGPTENTTFTTYYEVNEVAKDARTVPIGKPISNSYAHILSDDRLPAPAGVPGELYIGGPGLALGYHNQPELTAAAFVPDPYRSGARLYRSGDLARYLDDGAIEFVGRIDGQVKLRGFRIELGEIQAALNAHEDVRDSVVLLREDEPGEKRLVAYLVTGDGPMPDSGTLRGFLQRTLPDYMIPSVFVSVEAIPLDPNGKVDRRALPAPDATSVSAAFVAPRTPLEDEVAALWAEVLHLPRVGVEDRFFAIGGHSLLAVRIMAAVRDRYGVDVPLTRFFQNPTVAGMAALIQGERGEEPVAPDDTPFTLVPIQSHGTLPPLFCVATAGGVLFPYYNLAPLLGPDQPLFGLQDPALEGTRPNFESVEDLATHYVDVMQSRQPEGPYYLCGWSFGGTVAFEMARQLRERNEEVALLVIIDAMQAPPDLSVKGGIGKFLRIWLRRARIFILNTYHLKPYIIDGLYLVFRRGRKTAGHGPVSLRDYFRWAFTNVVFKHAGIANVVSKDNLLMMKLPAFRRIFKVLHANGEIWKQYVAKPFDGVVTLFRAEVQPPELVGNHTLGWGQVAGRGTDVHVIPGYHAEILGQGIRHCAEHLRQCLARSRSESEPVQNDHSETGPSNPI